MKTFENVTPESGGGSHGRSLRSRLRLSAAAALFGILVTASVAFGSASTHARSASAQAGPNVAAVQYGHDVTICHNGHTQSVNSATLSAHLAQGDTRVACTTPPKVPGTPAPAHI